MRKNGSTPFKTVPVEEAVGMTLAHDMTEIIPGKSKGPAFKRGHKVTSGDLCRLMRMGKNNLYILDLDETQVHEDEAVFELASALAGPGVEFSADPKEGKLELRASYPGLYKVDVEALTQFNMFQDVMCGSIHTNTNVQRNQSLAATRAIPLVIERRHLDEATALAKAAYPILSVAAYKPLKIRLAIIGNEVYNGLIQDRFQDIVETKVRALGTDVLETCILPDDREIISGKIKEYLEKDTDLIITTGGMSVDPDDVTRESIEASGFDQVHYSSAVLPGAMFLLGYTRDTAIMGLPACGLYHKTTIFDLILPRLMAGERPGKRDLASLCHGGLCMNCTPCRFPECPFGKTA
ncbi:MAG TPA: molybdopterin-binding protein [Desulfobacteraceae bacterium]|nr:molybdopterin-binding protein [Desulfobacteraceae bacterium]